MCTFVRSSRLPHPEIRLNDIDIAVGKPRLRSNYALMQARNQVILCNKGVAHRHRVGLGAEAELWLLYLAGFGAAAGWGMIGNLR